jgi:hypothetical protein
MRRMLEELYFGNINPNEKQFIRDSEYAENMQIIADNEEKFTLLLTGKEKDLFLDFVNAQGSVDAITAIENFIIGFRLGVRIGIEIMDGEDGVLQDIS